MIVEIYRERLPYHPLLGRNVHLDSRSLAYAVQPAAVEVTNVRWPSSISVLDQGDIGSCTGNAGVSNLYHRPFYGQGDPAFRFAPSEDGALYLYADATAADSYAGTFTYPPPGGQDTGSDGLTICRVLHGGGDISGYQPALDLDSSLQALMVGPGITGLPWYNSMFDAPASGLLTVDMRSGLAGGHEICVDEVVLAGAPGNGTGSVLVGGPNSWGTGWGNYGRWYMKATDWWKLRKRQGDVYFMVPVTKPAPIPTPPPDDPDAIFWSQAQEWARAHKFI